MARNLTSDPVIIGQELYSSSATAKAALGERVTDGKGRNFRYVKAGGTALVVGNVIQAPAEIADHYGTSIAAAAIGDTSLTVTPGATGGAANLYEGGWAIIDTAGVSGSLGYAYPIASHAAITASVAFTLYLDLPLQTALNTSNKVTLTPNPYRGVIQAPVTTLTGAVVGVCVYPIAASEYGWVQVSGPCATLTKGTPGPGVAVVSPGSAAGAVVVDGATAATQVIGSMMVTGVDGKVLPVHLRLD